MLVVSPKFKTEHVLHYRTSSEHPLQILHTISREPSHQRTYLHPNNIHTKITMEPQIET
jgi:hypothetical protein